VSRLAFERFAGVHGASGAGDALVAIALSGTLFFSVSAGQARSKVALYLLLTMAPFAVLSPVIGPFIDRRRGARRLTILSSCAGRAAICLLVASHVGSLAIYPAAFAILVLSKSYGIARAAIVPSLAPPGRSLVAVNARLAKIAIAAGAIASIPGVILLQVFNGGAVMTFAAIVFALGTLVSLALPKPRKGGVIEGDSVGEALASHAIRRAAFAAASSRALVGFLLFLLAFGLKRAHVGSAGFGFVLGCAGIGSFVGAVIVPRLRKGGTEEWVIAASLLLGAGASLIAQSNFGLDLAAVLAGAVGVIASGVRLGFEALVQREAPEAARGRVFARFETLFQLAWVLGAALPTMAPIGIRGGLIAASVVYALTAAGYLVSLGREGRARLES
jgi:hypothetical protein